MRNLVRKYKLDSSIEVVVADGVTYCNEQHFDRVLVDAECTHEGSLKHLLKFRADKDTKRAAKNSKRLTKQQKKQFKQNNSNIYTS